MIGVCHPRKVDQMGRMVKKHGIPYPVCEEVDARISTAYKVNGKLTHDFPMTLKEIESAEPVYELHPGWSEDISGVRRYDDLPANARSYIERVEVLAGVPVELLSIGPGRDATISRNEPFRPV